MNESSQLQLTDRDLLLDIRSDVKVMRSTINEIKQLQDDHEARLRNLEGSAERTKGTLIAIKSLGAITATVLTALSTLAAFISLRGK